jgi:hypothetical protein
MTTKNTGLVVNFEATPQVANNAAELAGVVRTANGTVELAAGDSTDNDIVMLAPIPSNASIPQLFVGADELGGSCTYNVGLYKTDGTVKDEDVFATAVDVPAALADLRFEVADLNTGSQKLWELAGDSTDPGGYYYIAVTFSATGGTAETMNWNISYVVN